METQLFPPTDLVAGSFFYAPELLGIEALGPGFSASYKIVGESWTLFVSDVFTDEKAAKAALAAAQGDLKSKAAVGKIQGKRVAGWTAEDASDRADAEESYKKLVTALLKDGH